MKISGMNISKKRALKKFQLEKYVFKKHLNANVAEVQ